MRSKSSVHGFPTAPVGPVAKCKACGNAAMVPVSLDALGAALEQAEAGIPECAMECAYCGAKDTVSGTRYVDHAALHGDAVRAAWTTRLAEERAKVERLKEGRW